MDAMLFGGAPIVEKSAMVDRVIEYVSRFYEGEVSESNLRAWSIRAVDEIWGGGLRVTKYVPMLAIRDVRELVLASLEERLEAGETLPHAAERDLWILRTEHEDSVHGSKAPTDPAGAEPPPGLRTALR